MRRARSAIALILLAGFALACRTQESQLAKRRPGEEHRRWSGISFADSTVVDRFPTRSKRAAGFDSERVWSGDDDWEPYVAVDAERGFVYQFTTRWVTNNYKIAVRRSTDGGATWDVDQLIFPSPAGQADPYAKVTGDGTVFAIWLEVWDTVLTKSTDFGVSWSPPVSLTSSLPWSDYPSIAISPDGRDVYVAFNTSDSYVVASHDFGDSFSTPVRTNSDNRYWFHGGGDVAPCGDVLFGASSQRQSGAGEVEMFVLASRDGGASWESTEIDVSAETPPCSWAPGCSFGFLTGVPTVAVDSAGTVLVAYNAGRADGEPQQIWARRSLDGGATWLPRRRLSKPWPTAHNGFSDVEAGPVAGDFRIVWQGTFRGNVDAWNTYYRHSTDSGATWASIVRLSDLGSGAPYKAQRGYTFPYGDYLALAVDDLGDSHVTWGEGASWNGPGGTWYTRGQ